LKAAARAAIVVPVNFAFADRVIQNADTTLFAVFGSFAMLVLADFSGPWKRRLAAYVSLAAAGFVLIALGTLCSETPWLAVTAMAVVGFGILISGVISGYFAAAGFAALLLFIIPVAFPGSASVIPDRLEGWALACTVSICAAMLLWPTRPREVFRSKAAGACEALADLLDAERSGDRTAIPDKERAAGTAVAEVRRSFVATPYRPTGPTGPTEALAFLIDALEWVRSAATANESRLDFELDPCRPENREVMAAASAVLRTSSADLGGEQQTPDFERLDRARDAAAQALAARIGDLSLDAAQPVEAPQPSFRMREISLSVRAIGVSAMRAAGVSSPALEPPEADGYQPSRAGRAAARSRSTARATGRLLLAHASPQSAAFQNSVRGAAALSAAVLVIQFASVQHAFWVVLATLSVLRSNALGTGTTVFSAVAGTVVGIVVGGALIYAIGTHEPLLWALLPFAILLAAYAPRAISFAAGQAGFTVVVLIIFNIIVPTGWQLGLLRVEDVAIGCAISLAVGVLFWPRGAETLVRESMGAAYARAADYVAAATRRLAGPHGPSGPVLSSARAARAAADRLDDAFRQYLAEPSARRANLDSLVALVSGAVRLRLAAYSLSTLAPVPIEPAFRRCAEDLTAEAGAVGSWYASFADAIQRRTELPPPSPPEADGDTGGPVVRCVSDALTSEPGAGPESALGLLWAGQHLDRLWGLAAELVEPAAELPDAGPRAVSGMRRRFEGVLQSG
jgi:uncharacterized membrane protein YccC